MASANRSTDNIHQVLIQTGAIVQGLAQRETEVERDEPCVMFLSLSREYANRAWERGLRLETCYGARPAHLVQRKSSDPHHPVFGELSLRWASRDGPIERIKQVRRSATISTARQLIAKVQP